MNANNNLNCNPFVIAMLDSAGIVLVPNEHLTVEGMGQLAPDARDRVLKKINHLPNKEDLIKGRLTTSKWVPTLPIHIFDLIIYQMRKR